MDDTHLAQNDLPGSLSRATIFSLKDPLLLCCCVLQLVWQPEFANMLVNYIYHGDTHRLTFGTFSNPMNKTQQAIDTADIAQLPHGPSTRHHLAILQDNAAAC